MCLFWLILALFRPILVHFEANIAIIDKWPYKKWKLCFLKKSTYNAPWSSWNRDKSWQLKLICRLMGDMRAWKWEIIIAATNTHVEPENEMKAVITTIFKLSHNKSMRINIAWYKIEQGWSKWSSCWKIVLQQEIQAQLFINPTQNNLKLMLKQLPRLKSQSSLESRCA